MLTHWTHLNQVCVLHYIFLYFMKQFIDIAVVHFSHQFLGSFFCIIIIIDVIINNAVYYVCNYSCGAFQLLIISLFQPVLCNINIVNIYALDFSCSNPQCKLEGHLIPRQPHQDVVIFKCTCLISLFVGVHNKGVVQVME